jgi:eukaryotic-like serine/threonine-protein kinase
MSVAASGSVAGGPEDPLLIDLIDQIARKVQAGEPVDLEACTRAHPEHADRLCRLLPAVQMLTDLGRSAASAGTPPEPGAGTLGDFRLLGEVGRGGMGVVYEAEQLSLRRRVALKVLPLAAALDPKQLRRFQQEAQAAANLVHQNIVAVHAVGCERGVHYYAMQFIDGLTLADVIQQLRTDAEGRTPEGDKPPASQARAAEDTPVGLRHSTLNGRASCVTRDPPFFHTVAHLGVQAAEALEHAHQLGVVHRDVKPANLLVDGRGHLWVTDFGLARIQGEAGLSLTGDVVGTLRYMSPEQAAARHGLVDHRTDIYSLGVTLHELLTLEPAFAANDRQELLRQVTTEEPVPPRRRNPAIPKDLETIVLKATAKEPAERYATAQQLADDLRRFLGDKPVQARRPTLWQRAARWARRHRPLVACVAVSLLLALVGLAISTVLIWRAEREATAGWARAREAHVAETRERKRAEANADMAFAAAERMYAQAFEEWLANQPGLDEAPRRFLREALAFYERFAAENGANPKVRRETARAYARVGRIHNHLGAPDKAETAFGRAVDLQQALADEFPGEPGCRHDLAVSLMNRVDFLIDLDRLAEAEQDCRRAQLLLRQLREGSPRSAQYRDGAARMHNALGIIGQRTGRPQMAGEQSKQSLTLARQLRDENPASPHHRRALAVVLHDRGLHLQDQGRLREAEDHLRQSNDLKRRLVKDFPGLPRYRADLANGATNLGDLLRKAGRLPEAEEAFREVMPLWQRLATEFPRVHDIRHGLARNHHFLGRLLQARGQLPEAEREIELALSVLKQLADEVPRVFVYRHDLVLGHRDLGDVRREAGRLAEAVPAFLQARDLSQKLADEFPRQALCRQALANAQNNLGGVLTELGRLDEALSAQQAALKVRRGLVDELPDKAEHRDSLAWSLRNLAHLLRRKGDPEGRVPLLREAIRHESAALAKRPRHAPYRDFLRQVHLFLADALAELGRHAEAAEAAAAAPGLTPEQWKTARDAASILTRCARLAAKDAAVPEDARPGLARAYAEQARSWLREAGRRAANDPEGLNDLARLMAFGAEPEVSDARQAVALAGLAVKQRPEVGEFWCTLGVAHYRAGAWRAAEEALAKARAMLKGHDQCVAGFTLAMACWQAGERQRARDCYDQAVRDARALAPPSRMVEALWAEAAALLNLPAPDR